MIKREDGLVEFYDLEGQLCIMTEQNYDNYRKSLLACWDMLKPTLNNIKNKVILTGTRGDFDNDSFGELFYKPINYNIIDINTNDTGSIWFSKHND